LEQEEELDETDETDEDSLRDLEESMNPIKGVYEVVLTDGKTAFMGV
jgi:hypothetical protein